MDTEEENKTKFSVKNRLQMFEKNEETSTKPFVRRTPKEVSQEEYKGKPPQITKPVPKPHAMKAENFNPTTKQLPPEDKTAKFTNNSQNPSDKNILSSKSQDVHLISRLNEGKVSPVQPPPRQYSVKSTPGRLPPKPYEFKLTSPVPSTKGSLSSPNNEKMQSVTIPTGEPSPIGLIQKIHERKLSIEQSGANQTPIQQPLNQPPPVLPPPKLSELKSPPVQPLPMLSKQKVPPLLSSPPLCPPTKISSEKISLLETSNNLPNQMQLNFNSPPPIFTIPKLPDLRLPPPVQPPPNLHEFKAPLVPPPPPLPSTSELNEGKEIFQDSSNNLSSHSKSTFNKPPPMFGPQKTIKTKFPKVNPPPEINEFDTFEVPPPPLFSSPQLDEDNKLLCESSNNFSNQMQTTFEQYPSVCDSPNISESRQYPKEQSPDLDEFEIPQPPSLPDSQNEIQSSNNKLPIILHPPNSKEIQELSVQPPPTINVLEESHEIKDAKTQQEKKEAEITKIIKQVPRLTENITHPPLPPPPPSKLAEASTQGIANNLKEHSLSSETAPNLPPHPQNKSAKKNVLIGWVSNPKIENSSNQGVTQSKSSSNVTTKVMESNKPPAVVLPPPATVPPATAPPIVVAPPSLESIKVTKERDQTASNIKVTNVQPKAQIENINEEQYDEDEDITNEPWFFNVSKEEATRLMKKTSKKGIYIVRPSENNQYVVMVRIENNETKKFKIQKHNGGWILGDPSNTKKVHDSLTALMKHYQKHGIKVGNVNIYLKEPLHKS